MKLLLIGFAIGTVGSFAVWVWAVSSQDEEEDFDV